MLAAILGGVHLIAVLAIIAGYIIILAASAPTVSRQDLQAINQVYFLTGLALVVAATAGIALWQIGAKPAAFYNNNPVFHAKMGMFMLLLVITAYTGIKCRQAQHSHAYAADNATEKVIALGNFIRPLQKAGIVLLLVIPLMAWMMARGIGY